jgi:hypothetical protein
MPAEKFCIEELLQGGYDCRAPERLVATPTRAPDKMLILLDRSVGYAGNIFDFHFEDKR